MFDTLLSRLRSNRPPSDRAPDLAELTAMFRTLGARNPEIWAHSQVEEGIGQLHRYLFLRQMWTEVVAEDDDRWIDAMIALAERNPTAPYAGVGHALRELRDGGASVRALTDLVRGMQAELLFRFCYLLDDPSFEEPELAGIGWRLVEADEDGQPTDTPICGLYESVFETDPTGREMRPREKDENAN